jgi:hypothetical protein
MACNRAKHFTCRPRISSVVFVINTELTLATRSHMNTSDVDLEVAMLAIDVPRYIMYIRFCVQWLCTVSMARKAVLISVPNDSSILKPDLFMKY